MNIIISNEFSSLFRFVINTCRRLKEKKSYMVYTAVACLGVCALSDLINEVFEPYHALQCCFHVESFFSLYLVYTAFNEISWSFGGWKTIYEQLMLFWYWNVLT